MAQGDRQDAGPFSTQRLLTAEEIAMQAGGAMPFLRLPRAESVFAERAERLRRLATSHALSDYLLFCAAIAQQQHRALQSLRLPPPPLHGWLADCAAHGIPPLAAGSVAREAAWRNGLRALLASLASSTEGPTRAVIDRLQLQTDDFFEAQASILLAGRMRGLDIAATPVIGAALQLHYTWKTLAFARKDLRPLAERGLCPCCGHRPVASVVRIGGNDEGYRFLHCGLCSTEWHLVRISCAHCLGTRGMRYEAIDDGRSGARHAVQAEVCASCNHYSKILYQDRDPHVDPVADDVASLSLDLLLSEAGLERNGINFLLVNGAPHEDSPS